MRALDPIHAALMLYRPPQQNDEHGATAIEYGLIAAGISVAIITVVAGLVGSFS